MIIFSSLFIQILILKEDFPMKTSVFFHMDHPRWETFLVSVIENVPLSAELEDLDKASKKIMVVVDLSGFCCYYQKFRRQFEIQ